MKRNKPAYVYVARKQSYCKVGSSGQLGKRFRTHRLNEGDEIEFTHVFRCADRKAAFRLETAAHRALSLYACHRKEWYRIGADKAAQHIWRASVGVAKIEEVPATRFIWNPLPGPN